ncbi:MAG: hypothetical protein BGN89_20815 [Alphaproteobacteria bacterium 64-6]|nr:MAG: hypothetical protein ABS54_06440 [Hyphomicrobium sp. SCN 65-11]OJU29134.1 MAG: hypothetical protein BGN89_20815 [Alphaproteobacteria bacterium 64-6]
MRALSADPTSKILDDFFEFLEGFSLRPFEGPDRSFETMIEMILDKCPPRQRKGPLDGEQLLRDVEAWPAFLDHSDNGAHMTIGSLEAFDDLWMCPVHV